MELTQFDIGYWYHINTTAMESNHLIKTSMLSLVIILAFFVGLELYWRGRGFTPTFNDDKVLWATKRKEIYTPQNEATVFIGGSRIKFDLDIPTWEQLTGEKAIQLAIVGTPARAVLNHIANDKNFKGKLIVDVAEGQFFSFVDSVRRDKFAREAIGYFLDETPAQRVSASINFFLESNFVQLEESKFGMNALLAGIGLPNRPGVNVRPSFPKEFGVSDFNRQTWMTPMFLADSTMLNKQMRFWRMGMNITPPIKGDTLETFLKQTKKAIDKIRARGGTIIFVRPPSSGKYIENETRAYPRDKYWDRLLQYTNTPGVHFADYPATSSLICPEWSHLTRTDAATYTAELIKILQHEKGWTFYNPKNKVSSHLDHKH